MSYSNFFNILRQAAVNAIVAAGMTFVILTGGIDLSVGSILAFSGAVLAKLIVHGAYEVYAIILLLLTGAFLGLLNGFIICKGKVQPFIATLAMMILLRGATLVFTDGSPITFSSNFELHILDAIGSGYFLGIPLSVYIMLLVFVIGYFILRYMKIGRYIYAVGCNEKATYIAGINTNIVKIFAYTVCGITAAISGLIATTRLFSAQPTMGSSYELDAIAAVVIGGTPLSGGRGSIVGTLIGALIISVLNNALNILNVSSYYQMVVKGLVILVAVILDRKNI
ncbi:MAG: ribose ABC transporter permease [Deferribacterota bacterium]|nr:ribose ABC transporter permease [Deferribacterota bacterium]